MTRIYRMLQPSRRYECYVGAWTLALALVVFAIDASLPLGIAGGVPYVAVVFCSLNLTRRRWTLAAGLFCSLLTVMGILASPLPENAEMGIVLTNCGLTLFAVWVTTILGILWKSTQRQVLLLNRALEQRVRDRTAELLLANEHLEQSTADLRHVAYLTSRELERPLAEIAQACTQAREAYAIALYDDAETALVEAEDRVHRLERWVGELVEYTRLDARDRAFAAVDCNDALAEAKTNFETALDEADARVHYDPLPTVMGNRTQIVRMFEALIANAIQCRGKAPLRISVRARFQGEGAERAAGCWVVCVADNGGGMCWEDRESAFDIFRDAAAAEPSTANMRLAICRRIVQRHGGEIWVDSDVGSGNKFYVALPGDRTAGLSCESDAVGNATDTTPLEPAVM